jgi:hypothetical protein
VVPALAAAVLTAGRPRLTRRPPQRWRPPSLVSRAVAFIDRVVTILNWLRAVLRYLHPRTMNRVKAAFQLRNARGQFTKGWVSTGIALSSTAQDWRTGAQPGIKLDVNGCAGRHLVCRRHRYSDALGARGPGPGRRPVTVASELCHPDTPYQVVDYRPGQPVDLPDGYGATTCGCGARRFTLAPSSVWTAPRRRRAGARPPSCCRRRTGEREPVTLVVPVTGRPPPHRHCPTGARPRRDRHRRRSGGDIGVPGRPTHPQGPHRHVRPRPRGYSPPWTWRPGLTMPMVKADAETPASPQPIDALTRLRRRVRERRRQYQRRPVALGSKR